MYLFIVWLDRCIIRLSNLYKEKVMKVERMNCSGLTCKCGNSANYRIRTNSNGTGVVRFKCRDCTKELKKRSWR